MPIDKVKFPNGETEDIRDSRVSGVDSTPTSGSANLVTSGGVKTALIQAVAGLGAAIEGKEDTANKVTSLSSSSTDTQYPSAKCVYDGLGTKQNIIDSSNKLDYSLVDNTPTIPTVPTISTNIQADKVSDTKTASPKATYDEIHPVTGSSQPSGGMLPNKHYKLGTLTGAVTFTLASPTDSNIDNYYFWSFSTGSTAPTITWSSSITSWYDGSAPTINPSKYYEVIVIDGVGSCKEI